MKVGIYVPVDDIGVIRAVLNERFSYVSSAISNTIGYAANAKWREERDAISRVLNAINSVAPEPK